MLLRELYEDDGKTAVLAFGRLNPPTIGHSKLVNAITSQPGDHYLFLSQTQKPKTDPLDFATKTKFVKQFFPNVNIGDEGARTPVQALEKLQSLGYTDIIFVAGSDRVEGFQKLFDTYNGQADKAGNIPFKFNSIKVVSAGERDPDAEGAEGMSASKMRAAAASGDLQSFAQGVPDKKLAQTMYDAVRRGMGVKDTVPAEGVTEAAEDRTSYQVAKVLYDHGIKYDPAKENELIKVIELALVKKLDIEPRQVRGIMNDEDFLGDTFSELRHMEQGVAEGGEYNKFRVGQRVIFKSSNGQEIPAIVTAVDFDEDAVKIKSADNKPLPNAGGDFETIVDPGWKFLTPEPRVDPNSIIAVSPNMRKTTERVRDPEDWDEGNTEPPNNFAVYINGKKWKVFQGRGQYADDAREKAHYQQLKNWAQQKSAQSGKKWEVYTTGEAPTA